MRHPNSGALPRNLTEAMGGTVVRVDSQGRQAGRKAGTPIAEFRTQEHNRTLVELNLRRLRRLIGVCQCAWRNSQNHFPPKQLLASIAGPKKKVNRAKNELPVEILEILR